MVGRSVYFPNDDLNSALGVTIDANINSESRCLALYIPRHGLATLVAIP